MVYLVIVLFSWLMVGATIWLLYMNYGDRTIRVLKMPLLVIGVVITISPFYYEYPFTAGDTLPTSKVVTFDGPGGTPRYRINGAFCWEWSAKCTRITPGPFELVSSVSPITSNPRVRNLTYVVEAKVGSIERFLEGKRPDNRNEQTRITRAVGYHLNEFNEKFSRELADFYNPLDDGQNEKFARLIEDCVNPQIANEGIVIKFISFRLGQ